MLTIFGKPHANGGFCDGVSRRDFLTVGGSLLGGGLMLPNLLAAEKSQGITSSHKAVINIFLPGGPPHLDMWDLKPDAPTDVRGEFKPIKTNVPRERRDRDRPVVHARRTGEVHDDRRQLGGVIRPGCGVSGGAETGPVGPPKRVPGRPRPAPVPRRPAEQAACRKSAGPV